MIELVLPLRMSRITSPGASHHKWFLRRVRAAYAVAAFLAISGAQASNFEVPGCGSLPRGFGPWDYRVDRGEPLALVESAHFTPVVENLIRGQSAPLAQDLDYTLRAFPNHHRALIAASRYADRLKTTQPQGMRYSIECWFERAVRFRPDDHTVRMIYASWLGKRNRREDALKHLSVVETRAGDSGFTHYNLGLVYFEMGEYESAVRQAHRAEALGMPRQDLKNNLKAAGKWVEPPAAAASATSAAASAP